MAQDLWTLTITHRDMFEPEHDTLLWRRLGSCQLLRLHMSGIFVQSLPN